MEGGGAPASGGALLVSRRRGWRGSSASNSWCPKLRHALPGPWTRAPAAGGSMSMRGRGQCGDAKQLPATCDGAEETGVPVVARLFVRRPVPRFDLAWHAAGGGGAVVEVVEKGEKKK